MESADDRRIAVSDETASRIREKVEDGSFASAAEVVAAAMDAMAREEKDRVEGVAMIRARIKASMEDTRPGYTSEEMRQHFLELYEKAAGKRHDSAA